MRRHEDHGGRVGALAHERGRRDAAQTGHLDVEEDDVRSQVARELERFGRPAGLADDLHTGVLGQEEAQLRPGRRLVVDERAP